MIFRSKKNKYNNQKTMIDDILFDSKKEAERYCVLKVFAQMGKIKNLRRQIRIELIPKTALTRARYYVADFAYTDMASGKEIFEDVKSEITAKDKVYRLKKDLLLWRYPGIEFREIL